MNNNVSRNIWLAIVVVCKCVKQQTSFSLSCRIQISMISMAIPVAGDTFIYGIFISWQFYVEDWTLYKYKMNKFLIISQHVAACERSLFMGWEGWSTWTLPHELNLSSFSLYLSFILDSTFSQFQSIRYVSWAINYTICIHYETLIDTVWVHYYINDNPKSIWIYLVVHLYSTYNYIRRSFGEIISACGQYSLYIRIFTLHRTVFLHKNITMLEVWTSCNSPAGPKPCPHLSFILMTRPMFLRNKLLMQQTATVAEWYYPPRNVRVVSGSKPGGITPEIIFLIWIFFSSDIYRGPGNWQKPQKKSVPPLLLFGVECQFQANMI